MRTESRAAAGRSARWPAPPRGRRYQGPGCRRCDRKSTVGWMSCFAPVRWCSCRSIRLRGQAEPEYSQRRSIASCGMSNHAGEFGREACVAVLDVSGQSRGDLLEHPAVAVRIAERGVGGVTLTLRIWAGDKAFSFG